MQVPLLLYSWQNRTTTAASVKISDNSCCLQQPAPASKPMSTFLKTTSSQGHAWKNARLKVQSVLNFCHVVQPAPAPKVVSTFLKATNPAGHAWKYMAMGPDGWLYIAVGSPCNK
jgi:hypothetical protein